ncbi:MAG: Cysteine desulfurase [uncultured Sphingomonas sp.]|uniref:Cysteine desulfurase n=1 Tax=uncultured Sphingomonas sp. TaxID=158754 RepID=A0A6J4SP25_9SPHN|nr:cysteine desulfurase family protein [uncultured Sphingomonas sp.]CAA9499332.1 MAG: Cysteine desulfurase [uncultured Sphingomonas sp.]
MIYLDYQATTPLAPEVRAAMEPWLDKFANPHSPNRWGREAAAAIAVAREQVAAAMPPDGELIFTSGATEAINWAMKGLRVPGRNKVVTVATEHAAVLDCCEWLKTQGHEVVRLPVRPDGLVELDEVAAAVDGRTLLVAAMLVNNEVGVIQPVGEIAAIAHRAGALMLCDAVQGFGRMNVPDGPDLVAVCAHKLHGPKMIGGLWLKSGLQLEPFLHGGGQEQGLRSGTLSPMLCAGFGSAAALAAARRAADRQHIERLWSAAMHVLGPGWKINGSAEQRYRGNLNIRRDGLDGARLMGDLREIAFSLGSACASGSGRPSHVLRALGLTDAQARSSLRLGFGRYTTEQELTDACRKIAAAADAQARFAA